jgi:membrane-associated protease RseP (regulator of RpoE activity)
MPTHKITLKRPTPVTKLGLTLSSTSENDPPFVKKVPCIQEPRWRAGGGGGASALHTELTFTHAQLVGISEASGLLVGDVVTEVNGTSCASSSAAMQLIARAGAEIVLLVTRDEGSEVHVTLRRGGRSLGLVMDARNVIVELVEESAAAVHGGVHVGDRILSINGTAVAPGENIVSLFPPGEALIALKLLRTQEVRTPQQQRPVDVPFNQQSTSKESAVAGFSVCAYLVSRLA